MRGGDEREFVILILKDWFRSPSPSSSETWPIGGGSGTVDISEAKDKLGPRDVEKCDSRWEIGEDCGRSCECLQDL